MRENYPYVQRISTRWKDNDVYGHVNNIDYYSFFDTVINTWLIREAGLDIHGGDTIGFCAESHCKYLKALAFPDAVDAALRVAHIGNSSVRYEIALFREGDGQPAAEGWFVHVFVARDTRRPKALPDTMRAALQRLHQESKA